MTIHRIAEWLFDLERIRLDRDAPLSLRFNSAWPAWLSVGCLLLAGGLIAYFYHKQRAGRVPRVVLAGLRLALVVWVGALLFQPSLVLQRNRIEPSHVVLLVDSSRSMALTDVYEDPAVAERIAAGADASAGDLDSRSRLSLVTDALLRADAAPLRAVLERNELHVSAFSSNVESLGRAIDAWVEDVRDQLRALRPSGVRTEISAAIRHVIKGSQGRRIAAVVVASDGQTTEATDVKDAIDLARGRQIPILPLAVGSAVRPIDIAVESVAHERRLFVHDLVAMEVTLSSAGLTGPEVVTVRAVDVATGAEAVSRPVTVTPETATATIDLPFKVSGVGRHRYRIEFEPVTGERNTTNNSATVELTVLDDQISVLYVEGYPRYEYRYLKNALLREGTLDVQVLLLESDRDFVQEGIDPVRSFPETPEGLNRFDVVLFGDVDPRGGWMSEAQMRMLLDFVGNHGGGFGLIAGERFAPARFRGLELARLLPVRIGADAPRRADTIATDGFRLQLTPDGRRSRLFRFLGRTNAPSDAERAPDELLATLPELYWCARVAEEKPGSITLAANPEMRTATGAMPVVVTGRYGAGKLLYLGTDDTWRWRRHTGEFLHDTFWLQVVRDLMRIVPVGSTERIVLRSDQQAYAYGQTVQLQVELLDPNVERLVGDDLTVVVREGPAPPGPGDIGTADAGTLIERLAVRRIGPQSAILEGAFVPPRAGSYVVTTDGIPLNPAIAQPWLQFTVREPELETSRPEANLVLLQRLATGTGGRMLAWDNLVADLGQIPDRSVQIPDDVVEPLWDSKFALMVFLGLITTEWVLRKLFGLL